MSGLSLARSKQDDTGSIAAAIAGLGPPWIKVRQADGEASPNGIWLDHVAIHPACGVALIGTIRHARPFGPKRGQIELLREFLREGEFETFFPGFLPVVEVDYERGSSAKLAEALATAFAHVPLLTIAEHDWAEALANVLGAARPQHGAPIRATEPAPQRRAPATPPAPPPRPRETPVRETPARVKPSAPTLHESAPATPPARPRETSGDVHLEATTPRESTPAISPQRPPDTLGDAQLGAQRPLLDRMPPILSTDRKSVRAPWCVGALAVAGLVAAAIAWPHEGTSRTGTFAALQPLPASSTSTAAPAAPQAADHASPPSAAPAPTDAAITPQAVAPSSPAPTPRPTAATAIIPPTSAPPSPPPAVSVATPPVFSPLPPAPPSPTITAVARPPAAPSHPAMAQGTVASAAASPVSLPAPQRPPPQRQADFFPPRPPHKPAWTRPRLADAHEEMQPREEAMRKVPPAAPSPAASDRDNDGPPIDVGDLPPLSAGD